jgi:hypothetical protein
MSAQTQKSLIASVPGLQPGDDLFLEDIFARFPKVRKGFEEYCALPPFQRIPAAAKKLEHLPRTGWLRLEEEGEATRDIRPVLNSHANEYYGPRWLFAELAPGKGTETVLEHCAEAQELFILVYGKNYPFLQWGAEVLKFHDFTEAITGDFTPKDTITKPEKKRLERIALGLLTEDRHQGNLHALHVYNCMNIYEGTAQDFSLLRSEMLSEISRQETSGKIRPVQVEFVNFLKRIYGDMDPDLPGLTKRTGDIDALHMGLRAMRIERDGHFSVQKDQALAHLGEFYAYIGKKLSTPEAMSFFADMGAVNKEFPQTSYTSAVALTVGRHRGDFPRPF